jgi:hypothetical protein
MDYEKHRQRQRGILLLVFASVSLTSLILFPVNKIVEKVAAAPNNVMKVNKAGLNNPASNKNPIYQASGWTLRVIKLKSAGFPQQVELILENGTIPTNINPLSHVPEKVLEYI